MPDESQLEALQVAILEIRRHSPHGGNVNTIFAALMKLGGFGWVENGAQIHAAVEVLKQRGEVEVAEPSPHGSAWKAIKTNPSPKQSDPADPAPTFSN